MAGSCGSLDNIRPSVNPVGFPPSIFLPPVTIALEYGEQVIHVDEKIYSSVQDSTTFLLILDTIIIRIRLATYSNYGIRSHKLYLNLGLDNVQTSE